MNVIRHRPDLVERAGEGDETVAADATVRRLQSDDPTEACRLTDRTSRVASQRQRSHPGCDSGSAPARGASGSVIGVPGIARRFEGAVLGGRAHRELVEIRPSY